jgi:hypothetical protein
MEIGATSSSSYLPPQLAEPRVARNVTREISGAREGVAAIRQDRKEDGQQSPGLPSNHADSLKTTEIRKTAETQATKNARNEREKQAAAEASEVRRAQQQEVVIAAGGSIKLDVEDGNHVLKVFDSKDVLIYQMPPKGALMLIKAQENAEKAQVQTSA